MAELLWAADIEVNGKMIRAEYSDEADFQCEDKDVMLAYGQAMMWNETFARPINLAFGEILVEADDPVSVAALLFQALSSKTIGDFTLYGTGYLIPTEPTDPDMIYEDVIEIDEANMVADLPTSKFGFATPVNSTAKALADMMFAEEYEAIEDELTMLEAEIAKARKAQRARNADAWHSHPIRKYHDAIVEYYTPMLNKAMAKSLKGVPDALKAAQQEFDAKAKSIIKAKDDESKTESISSKIATAAAALGATTIGAAAAAAAIAASGSRDRSKTTETEAGRHTTIEGGRTLAERLGLIAEETANNAVKANVTFDPIAAQAVLDYIYGDSAATGIVAAGEQVDISSSLFDRFGQIVKDILNNTNWQDWQPNENVAAQLVADDGIQTLLNNSGIDTIKSLNDIMDNAMQRLGDAISQGLQAGLPMDDLATIIGPNGENIVTQNDQMIAVTESARAQSAATMQSYMDTGITQYEWIAEADACDKDTDSFTSCQTLADEGPYDVPDNLGDEDPTQPNHPWCRCAYRPIVNEEQVTGAGEGEDDQSGDDQSGDEQSTDGETTGQEEIA